MPRRIKVAVTGLGVSRSMLHEYRGMGTDRCAPRRKFTRTAMKAIGFGAEPYMVW
ncbi:MAG: hypothetical protein AMXMBFR7_20390 [Planctomycetota bacterium]